MAFTHNSTLAESEPSWGSVDKTKVPAIGHAVVDDSNLKTTWHAPHHWISDPGGLSEDLKVWTTGTMWLNRGGLIAAKAATQGARTGKIHVWRPTAVPHLNRHLGAVGLERIEMSWNPDVATAIALACENISLDDQTLLDIVRYNLDRQPDAFIAAALSDDELVVEWGRFSAGWQKAVDESGPDCKCARTLYDTTYEVFEEIWLRGLDVVLDGPLEATFATMPGFGIPAAQYMIEGVPEWSPHFQEDDGDGDGSANNESFSRFLNGHILRQIGDDNSRADVEAKLIEAAGIDQSRLNALLDGSALPTLDELRGFASVVWTGLEELMLAAEASGAEFAEGAETEDGEGTEE